MLFFSALLAIGAAGGGANGVNNIPDWLYYSFVLAIVILFVWFQIKK
jgi:hypothetical protein